MSLDLVDHDGDARCASEYESYYQETPPDELRVVEDSVDDVDWSEVYDTLPPDVPREFLPHPDDRPGPEDVDHDVTHEECVRPRALVP